MGNCVDLHVHSYYSDGSMSPDELVEEAAKNGVGALAIADHDVVKGSKQLKALCEAAGIRYIPAVEIDTLERGKNVHILAYGFDMQDSIFLHFLSSVRFLLDESSVKLIEAMQKDYSGISIQDFMEYTYDASGGGWKALHYMLDKGISGTLKDGIGFYPQYGIGFQESGYPTIRSACYRIQRAGGRAVLAHPGELLDPSDTATFQRELHELVRLGLDGIECYYPSHSDETTRICVDLCRENHLLITAGSDCHGSFGSTRVGEMNIASSLVSLSDL